MIAEKSLITEVETTIEATTTHAIVTRGIPEYFRKVLALIGTPRAEIAKEMNVVTTMSKSKIDFQSDPEEVLSLREGIHLKIGQPVVMDRSLDDH